ncbi:hypothetical protein BDR07DRAFT_1486511 [Suillus spraguei]|nr:hypothetical protein BDR07DRAFT_1486511 [Suillus spraguei]
MPRVAGTRLMLKERGGKTQVAFRKALGIRGDQDSQFQAIKHRIRTLALKHFEIGRKPREQEQIIKERFLADVQKAFPIFRDNDCAHAHLLKYVDAFLHAKAVPGSRFYQMAHRHDIADGDWERMLANSQPSVGPLISQTTSDSEVNEGASRLFISNGIQVMVQKPSISNTTLTNASRTTNRSLSPLAMSTQYTTSRECNNQPRRASSASTVLASNDPYDTTPVRNFLGGAALGHLLEECMTLGIKNQSRLLLVATWSEEDVHVLLRDSVRESRIDKFEAQQLIIALRSLHRRSMQVGD